MPRPLLSRGGSSWWPWSLGKGAAREFGRQEAREQLPAAVAAAAEAAADAVAAADAAAQQFQDDQAVASWGKGEAMHHLPHPLRITAETESHNVTAPSAEGFAVLLKRRRLKGHEESTVTFSGLQVRGL